MKSLKGTKTAENLLKAFAGESQARNRYTYYASVARKEAMYRFPISFWRRPTMRRNMQNDSLSF